MIPRDFVTEWRNVAPWPSDEQVEQDLIISRTVVEIFNVKEIAERLGVSPATISYQLNRINEIAKRDGDDKTLLAFLFGAGLGLLVASVLNSGGNKDRK